MEKSEKVPELDVFSITNKPENSLQLLSPEVTVNQIFHANQHQDGFMAACCMDVDYFCQKSPCRVGQANREIWSAARAAQHKELMQHREPGGRGATPGGISLHHRPLDGRSPRPAGTREGDTGGKCSCWDCRPTQRGATGPANTTRGEDEYTFQLQSDEDLEPPLPLRSDDEWQHYSPFLPPHQYMHSYDPRHTMDVRYYPSAAEGQCNLNPAEVSSYQPQPCHHSAPWQHERPWDDFQDWLQRQGKSANDSLAQGSVSVNVPQFFVPPAEVMSQVSVMNLSSAGAEASVSHPHEKRRTVSLPDECRNIFVTYSSDISSEIIPFVDFLTKQGFRPAIDLFDNPIRHMDINKWKDLKDPSTLIIIGISPKYKADIEGCIVDSHALHTKYIHSMMQNEFIQQGSLNFRFIPILFLNASQKDVPSWLQNTCVYRWPRDTEDLLLRLLREERYIPPPIPLELTLIIRPVAPSSAATL